MRHGRKGVLLNHQDAKLLILQILVHGQMSYATAVSEYARRAGGTDPVLASQVFCELIRYLIQEGSVARRIEGVPEFPEGIIRELWLTHAGSESLRREAERVDRGEVRVDPVVTVSLAAVA